jgi:hypothetical protein
MSLPAGPGAGSIVALDMLRGARGFPYRVRLEFGALPACDKSLLGAILFGVARPWARGSPERRMQTI